MPDTPSIRTAPLFTAACIGMCFFGVSMIVLGAIMPMLQTSLNLSEAEITSLTVLLPLALLAGSVIFGPIADRFGHKILLIADCTLILAGIITLATATNLTPIRIAICAIGFGGGVLNGETNALVSDIYTGATRASRLSLLGTFYGLGALTIPILLSALTTLHYTTILLTIAIIMACAIAYCIPIHFPAPKQAQGFPLREASKIIIHPAMWICALILFFQSGTEGITNNWSTMYLINTSLDLPQAQIALSSMLIGLTLARIILTWLMVKIKTSTILYTSLSLAAAGYYTLLNGTPATHPFIIYLSMAIIGAGLASTFPIILGSLADRFPHLTGTAFSFALLIALTGQTSLNYIQGQAGYSEFPIVALTAIGAMIMLRIALPHTQNKTQINKQLSN